jgi:predicted amidohydrolase YtcJ
MSYKNYSFFALLILIVFSCQPPTPTEVADTILTNANVYTLAWDNPNEDGQPAANAPFTDGKWQADAAAIALKDGKILFVGSNDAVLAYKGSETEVKDVQGNTIIPGLIESHGHLQEIGEWREEISIAGLDSEIDIADKIAQSIIEFPKGQWIKAIKWDEGAWHERLPNMDILSQKTPDHPVVVLGMRGFAVWGNRKALEIAGIDRNSPSPDGGEIVKDKNGNPTGVFLNNAKSLLTGKIPKRDFERKRKIILYGMEKLAEGGFVSVHHAGVRKNYMSVYEALNQENNLPIRLEVFLAATKPNLELINKWKASGPKKERNTMMQVQTVKAYYDGSLGSRGARLIEDYSDHKGHKGVSGEEYGFDTLLVEDMMKMGFQVAIHAIGDEGNREVLNFYEKVFQRTPSLKNMRHRIEHAQIVHPADFERFSSLDLVASMQPPHAVEDSPWAEDRVGPERIKGAYAWRTMRKNKVDLIFNSDFLGTDYDIFYGLHCAITRTNKEGLPQGGWYPEQRVTSEEALRAYTVWPAYASRLDDLTGTIEKGKWADLTIMDVDPLNINEDNAKQLLNGKIMMTIVNGKIAYERK